MSVEQFIAILGALTALIGGVTAAYIQARQTHMLVNSRMSQLLELATKGAHAEGILAEKDAVAIRAADQGDDKPSHLRRI